MIRPSRSLGLTVLVAVLAVSAGCSREANRFTPGTPGKGLIVVVAPVTAPAVVAAWPEASMELAYTAAGRIDFFGKGVDGQVGEQLPPAAAPAWAQPVAGLDGAEAVVLITLEAPHEEKTAGGQQMVVDGNLRILDAHGREEFNRRVHGTADAAGSAKLIGPAHSPTAHAAADAAADAASQVVDYFKGRSNRPVLPPTVAVTLGSVPANADVLVDGALKGTTPCTVQLPTKAVTVRLERQGYRPWERTLTASEPLALTPALEPVAP